MANLTAVIGADTSRFTEEIKSAQYMLDKFINETKNQSSTIKKNTQVTNDQIQSYQRVIKSLEKVASGTLNTKQQQQILADQIKELKVQWQGLSDSAKTGGFGQSLADTLKTATTQLDDLKNKLANVDDVKPSGTLKKQLRETTLELTNLTAKYRAMSAAEKSSAAGRELANKMDELREKAGGLADTIGDVQSEIKVMASDTPNLDVFNDVLGIGADLLSTYSSILAKVTGDEESLKNAISTVMAVQSAANLMTKVTNALQSSSAIMLKTRAIQEGAAATAIKIRAAAETKGTIATKAATVAQKAFNVVAKANPYVLLGTAALTAGAAIYAFSKHTNEAEKAEKASQEAAEQAKKEWDDFKTTVSNAGTTLLATYSRLQTEWNNLKSTYEKNQWIKDNQQAFNNLGVEINDVGDAENFLVTNTDKVVQAFMMRAKAAAYAAKAEAMWSKYIDKEEEYDRRKVSAGDKVPAALRPSSVTRDKNGRTANSGRYNVNDALTITSFTQKGAEEYNKTLREQLGLTQDLQSEIQDLTEKEVKLNQQSQELLRSGGVRTKTSGGKTTSTKGSKSGKTSPKVDAPTYTKNSLTDLENKLSTLQAKYKDGLLPNLTTDKYLEQVDYLEKLIKQKKMELGLIPVLPEGSIAKINEEINKKQSELNLAVSDESRKKIQDEIDVLVGRKEAIEIKLKPVVDEDAISNYNKKVSEFQNDGKTNVDKLKNELDFHKEILSNYEDEYKAIQKRISLGAVLTDNEKQLVSIYDATKEKVNELADAYKSASTKAEFLKVSGDLDKKTWEGVKGGIHALGELNGGISGIAKSWTDLTENFGDMSAFEQMTAVFDTLIGSIESVISVYETINGLIELFGEISELSAQKKVAAAAAEGAAVATEATTEATANATVAASEEAANATTMATNAAASLQNQVLTATENTAAYAAIPFIGPELAAAAQTAYEALWAAAAIPIFADGGIFNGATSIGDYNIARVNDGEMILNGTQQKRLFNILDGTGAVGTTATVVGGEVKIKGSDLYVALKNYGKVQNTLGKNIGIR